MASSTVNTGPGKLLQEARESKNISIGEVSERLKLGMDIVEAIEANNLEFLPAPAFVRGYLRSYALLVDLDPAQIIEHYHGIAPPDPELSNIYPARVQKQGMDPIMLWVTAGIALVLLVLFILWAGNWYKSYLVMSKTTNEESTELVTTPYYSSHSKPVIEPEQVEKKVLLSPSPSEPAKKLLEAEALGTDLGEDESTSDLPAERGNNQVGIEPVIEAKEEVQPEVVAQDVGMLNEAESDWVINPVAPQGSDELLLLASGESWVNITDANGYRLVYRMIDESERLELRGQAPFDVVLGASPNVIVNINGEEYDHSVFTRANLSARFILRPQN